jgi:hypothetical protein
MLPDDWRGTELDAVSAKPDPGVITHG